MALEGQKKLAGGPASGSRRSARALIWGRWGIYFLLGFLLACGRVLQTGAPFGMALVACAGPGITGVCALAGAALGYLVSGGLEWGVRYLAASVLVYTVSYLFHELPVYRHALFMPAATGAVMAMTGFLGSFSYPISAVPIWAKLFLETALAFGGAYFFREALSGALRTTEAEELRHSVALMILSACMLMPLSRLVLLDTVSVGRLLALLLVMTSASKGGMLTGAAVGTLLGLAVDLSWGGAPFYTMAYAFCGLLSGVFSRHGRFLFVLSFLLADTLAVICAWNAEISVSALMECFCASVLFLLLPASVLTQIGVVLQAAERGSGESGLRRFVAGQVRQLSEAYGELFQAVQDGLSDTGNDENIAKVFDRAADAVCVRCSNKNRCWNASYLDTP